jgi:hypothetical protein
VDHFASWAGDLKKRIAAQGNSSLTDPSLSDRILTEATGGAAPNSGAGLDIGSNPPAQDISLALCSGAALVRGASRRARGSDVKKPGDQPAHILRVSRMQ